MIIKIKRRKNGARGGMPSGGRLIYAKPSFLEGVARLFDFGGTLNTYYLVSSDEDPREVDARAIASDWEAVGRDMSSAIGQYDTSSELLAAKRRRYSSKHIRRS